jgi:hypothetical protein
MFVILQMFNGDAAPAAIQRLPYSVSCGIFRPLFCPRYWNSPFALVVRCCSSVVEHVIGNDGVGGPIPLSSTIFLPAFFVLYSGFAGKQVMPHEYTPEY